MLILIVITIITIQRGALDVRRASLHTRRPVPAGNARPRVDSLAFALAVWPSREYDRAAHPQAASFRGRRATRPCGRRHRRTFGDSSLRGWRNTVEIVQFEISNPMKP